MTTVTPESLAPIRQKLNELLSELGTARRAHDDLVSARDEKIRRVVASHDPDIEEAAERIELLKESMRKLAEPHARQLFKRGTITIELPSGTMSYFGGAEVAEFDDAEALMAAIRKHKWASLLLHRKITVNPDKQALKKHPRLTAQLTGLVRLVRKPEWKFRPGKLPGVTLSSPATVDIPD